MPEEKVRAIFLCKTIKRYSEKYNGKTHCTAGIRLENGNSSKSWIRLYPLYPASCKDIEKWDIVEVGVESWDPEERSESIKTVPDKISKRGKVQSRERKRDILNKNLNSGEFLHRIPSETEGTLILTRPLYPRFYRKSNEEEQIFCEFFCNFEGCGGHRFEVLDSYVHDEVVPDEFRKGSLFFLFGTHRYVPYNWLFISAIRIP